MTSFFLLFFALHLGAQDIEPAPLLDFSLTSPLELSAENRDSLKYNNNIEEFSRRQFPWWPLAATLLVISAYILIRYMKPQHTEEEFLEAKSKKAKSIAIQELTQLQTDDLKNYFMQLSSVLRRYLENRYQIHSPVETTPEFLNDITLHPEFETATKNELATLFEKADNVKFAKHIPSFEECRIAFEKAYNIIKTTP